MADAFSSLRFDPKLPTPSTTSTAVSVSEETHKTFYELDKEQDLSFTDLETEWTRAESQAAMRTAIFAKLKRVPKIVGSVNHAIIPMPPVSHFVLLHCAVFGLLPSILSVLSHFIIIHHHYRPVLHFGHSLADVMMSDDPGHSSLHCFLNNCS